MVVPIRELANITHSTTTMANNSYNLKKNMSSNSLKVVFNNDIDMTTNPIGAMFNLNNNFDEVRGRSLDASVYKPRSPSVLSSEGKEEYHVHVQ